MYHEKIVYKYDNKFGYWTVSQFVYYPKSEMILLKMSFNEQYDWITVEIQGEQVIIWDSFDEKHESWDKISKLYLSKKNYDQVVDEWNKNAQSPAKYLTFCRDDKGWIHLEAKNELSQDDLAAIEQDRQAKLTYEQHK